MIVPLRAALYLRVSAPRQAEHDPDQRREGEAAGPMGVKAITAYLNAGRIFTRAAEADLRLKRLYDAIESRVAALDDPALKWRAGADDDEHYVYAVAL
jgi:hypothetical protein